MQVIYSEETGLKVHEMSYENGIKHGTESFFKDGQLIRKIDWCNGVA